MSAISVSDFLRRGLDAQNAGRIDKAVEHYLEALRREPENPQACRLLGEIALHSGVYEQAVQMLMRASGRLPHDPAIHVNLGAAYQALEKWDEAAASYRRALALRPDLAAAQSNLASVLAECGDPAGAEREYREVIRRHPGFTDAHINLGNLLRNTGRLDEAVASYRRAVECDSRHVMAHNNLGGALLMGEAWAEGWAELEWRWRLGDNPALRAKYPWPLWNGEPVHGRRLLLWAEQGIGDVLLFATMLPDLLRAGARLSLELDPRLLPLFARSFPGVELFASGQVPADLGCDAQANIGRLGLFVRRCAQDFATTAPYLVPDPARVAAFRQRYAGPGPVLGLSWRSTSTSHKRKSLALADLAPLFAALPQARYVSLQYGETAGERAEVQARFGVALVHDDSFDNWADLDGVAAQIAALDAVVTVSNVNAHMAGALGVPAHVLLTQNALWYWPQGKDKCLWYNSVVLHREEGLAKVAAQISGRLQ